MNSLKYKEQSTCDENQAQGEGQDPALPGQHDPSIAVKAILPGENFPFPPESPRLVSLIAAVSVLRGKARDGCRESMRVDLLILTVFHVLRSLLPATHSITDTRVL